MSIKKGTTIKRGMNLDPVDFEKNFDDYRLKKGLSIMKACLAIGISQTIHNRILNGCKCDPKTIKKIRDYFPVKLA